MLLSSTSRCDSYRSETCASSRTVGTTEFDSASCYPPVGLSFLIRVGLLEIMDPILFTMLMLFTNMSRIICAPCCRLLMCDCHHSHVCTNATQDMWQGRHSIPKFSNLETATMQTRRWSVTLLLPSWPLLKVLYHLRDDFIKHGG